MNAVGIRIEMISQNRTDLVKMAQRGQLQMWQTGNRSTTTVGYEFLSLLYGPNAGLSNLSRFKHPDYDRLYEESKTLPDGPARTKLVRQMSEIVAAYAPWKLNAFPIENVMVYPRVVGYKYNPFNLHPFEYLDIDLSRPRRAVE